ncbi:MAG: hypothetical protein IJU99_04715 [Lachnospiraceae bacterium]|nr:hypothetical protein [Lachnospiraceae bacterium]MBQ9562734.1 hypothetical protein [Lachnospiraceae bacterium]MBR0154168.1 hypothetical protein [Lachnospiraceae bacterium]
MLRTYILLAGLLVLILLVIIQVLWIRHRQVSTDYHDFPLHVYCGSDQTRPILEAVESCGCRLIYWRVTDDIPLDEAPPGSTLAVLLNVDAQGDEARFTELLTRIAELPGVLSVGEGETLPA